MKFNEEQGHKLGGRKLLWINTHKYYKTFLGKGKAIVFLIDNVTKDYSSMSTNLNSWMHKVFFLMRKLTLNLAFVAL